MALPENSFWIIVERWEYLCWKCENGSFAIWHHITPSDGGYGCEVSLGLPSDYFHTHTVEELYDYETSAETISGAAV